MLILKQKVGYSTGLNKSLHWYWSCLCWQSLRHYYFLYTCLLVKSVFFSLYAWYIYMCSGSLCTIVFCIIITCKCTSYSLLVYVLFPWNVSALFYCNTSMWCAWLIYTICQTSSACEFFLLRGLGGGSLRITLSFLLLRLRSLGCIPIFIVVAITIVSSF